ncbi:MAG: alpha-L-fucosidase [Clostridiales bacterium]|nr:alpha-L-fucosidase [Clostridiales bacterium]
MYEFNREEYEKRVRWFTEARFGMFIHWGIYAVPGRGEWVKSQEKIPDEVYDRYFEEFDPDMYDPKKWAKLAKKAGMKYAVLTTKHHDGFCLFDSAFTDYKATNTKAGRDLVREYVDAFRAEGLKIGFYYSLLDWHHPDYPHMTDRHHPMRGNPDYPDEGRNFDRYLDYLHNQVRELCTNYGKIDIIWFDFSYADMRGEKWRATELVNMVRELQPGILIDNRLEGSGSEQGSLMTGDPLPYHGDFACPEQMIPPRGLVDAKGKDVVWEACVTMNNHWGYCRTDGYFKPSSMVIKKLVECVSKGGNLLLNVGPDARGRIPDESVRILKEVGRWMERNSESVYGCGKSALPKPDYGRLTQRDGKTVYIHVFDNTVGPLPVVGVRQEDILSARDLATGAELRAKGGWMCSDYPDTAFITLGENPVLPDPDDTVIKLELR